MSDDTTILEPARAAARGWPTSAPHSLGLPAWAAGALSHAGLALPHVLLDVAALAAGGALGIVAKAPGWPPRRARLVDAVAPTSVIDTRREERDHASVG
ncbi:MAG: hypothetical protein EOO24_51720 [Comamonadaceae bacterium]|nr:MAG: hypothetical protein EOO24_51720 [Comamonadaceae bacterium]